VAHTISQARQLRELFKFLMALFILADGLNTATSIAILFSQNALGATNECLIIAALINFSGAAFGIPFFVWLQNRRGVPPLRLAIICTLLFGLIPAYCLIGLIPSVSFGFKHVFELYIIAFLFGFLAAPIFAASKVAYATMLPQGHENELYALFEITSASSSWLGPLVSGAVTNATHNMRQSFWFVTAQFYIPVVILLFVNVRKGRQDAMDFVERERRRSKRDEFLGDAVI
jgi:MFS transporter, UMF1 family